MEWLLGYEEIRGRGLQSFWKSNGNENTVPQFHLLLRHKISSEKQLKGESVYLVLNYMLQSIIVVSHDSLVINQLVMPLFKSRENKFTLCSAAFISSSTAFMILWVGNGATHRGQAFSQLRQSLMDIPKTPTTQSLTHAYFTSDSRVFQVDN